MPFAITNDIIKTRAITLNVAQVGINVRHWLVESHVGVGVSDEDLATQLGTLLAGAYKPLMSVAAQYRTTGVQIIRAGFAFSETFDPVGAGPGTQPGDPLPPQIAGLIKYRTGIATRSGLGYTYVPFPSETDSVAAGAPQALYLTTCQILADLYATPRSFGAGGNISNLVPVVYNRLTNIPLKIISATVRNVWSQQRRRSFLRRNDLVPG